MSARATTPKSSVEAPIGSTLAKWTWGLIGFGGLWTLAAAIKDPQQLGFSYLVAFMFFLSLVLGALFMVLVHHLFDASWSVPVRRYLEHLAFLAPWMFLLFLPIAFLAPRIYPWMSMAAPDHALQAKAAYLNKPFFYLRALVYFAVWSFIAYKLRYWSLRQDSTGAAECTHKMRRYSAVGVILFAITLTLAAVDWVKSLEHQWFSTMFGVYYFAASIWVLAATSYFIAFVLKRSGPLQNVLTPTHFYYLGSLMLAFTVFYAYIAFSQFFVIWNANLPEETFWYVQRESSKTWWDIGLMIIFGHFFLPFLVLLRIDFKLSLPVMIPLCLWCWLMHYIDLSFNIMPVLHPAGFGLNWMDLTCMVFIGAVLARVFLYYMNRHPVYPLRDPRLKESLTHHEIPPAVETVTTHGGGQ